MNIYKMYYFKYDEKKSFSALRKLLKDHQIKSQNDFNTLISEYNGKIMTDSLISYFEGRRRLQYDMLKFIANKLDISCQDIILPESTCLYDGKVNNVDLRISKYNPYDNYLWDFILEENIRIIYEEEEKKEFNDNYYQSKQFKKKYLPSIIQYEKIICKFVYLVQKYIYSYISRSEELDLGSSICNVYENIKPFENIFEVLKLIPYNDFYFDFYKITGFSYLYDDCINFIKMFLLCDKEIVSHLMSYLHPIEKDVFLQVLNKYEGYQDLKDLLIDCGAKINSLLEVEQKEESSDLYRNIYDSILILKQVAFSYSYEEYKKGYEK